MTQNELYRILDKAAIRSGYQGKTAASSPQISKLTYLAIRAGSETMATLASEFLKANALTYEIASDRIETMIRSKGGAA